MGTCGSSNTSSFCFNFSRTFFSLLQLRPTRHLASTHPRRILVVKFSSQILEIHDAVESTEGTSTRSSASSQPVTPAFFCLVADACVEIMILTRPWTASLTLVLLRVFLRALLLYASMKVDGSIGGVLSKHCRRPGPGGGMEKRIRGRDCMKNECPLWIIHWLDSRPSSNRSINSIETK